MCLLCFFFFKQKTAYEMRISDWSSDVCSSDLVIVYALADANGHLMRSQEKINYFPVTLGSWANLSPPFLRIAGPELAKKMIFTASITELGRAACRERGCQSV